MALNPSNTPAVAGSSSHVGPAPQGTEIQALGTHAYYPTSIPSYSSSLSGANGLPPAPPNNSQSPTIPSTPGPSSGKRRQPDDPSVTSSASSSKKRRAPTTTSGADTADGDFDKDDPDVGPNGGPKHWTDQEKTSLFSWILCHDAHWDAFNTKMNTVFRDTAVAIFAGRKTFTALKSCFHRNLEVFKQLYALEAFLARPAPPIDGTADAAQPPMAAPTHFNSATERQAFLEGRLEAARAAGAPVGNLNVKVIDHWYTMGWYVLFKNRYQEDPKTGLPVPLFGLGKSTLFADVPSNIDPQLVNGDNRTGQENGHVQESEKDLQPGSSTSVAASQQPQPSSTLSLIPPPVSLRSAPQGQQYPLSSPAQHPSMSYPGPPPFMPQQGRQPAGTSYWDARQVQSEYPPPSSAPAPAQQDAVVHALNRLTAVSQSLVEAFTELSGLIRAQGAAAASAAKYEGFNKKEKAALATEVLANADVGEEVRNAAAEYLKRLFVGE